MKSTVIALAGMLMFGAAASAQAQLVPDGTITFVGQVKTQTCVIDVAGQGQSATIPMDTAHPIELSAAGHRARRTEFAITVGSATKMCNQERVQVVFGGENINAEGRLKNLGGAENVEIVLKNANDQDINLNTNENSLLVPIYGDGVATVSLASMYHATGVATPGDVKSSVEYQVVYP